MRRLLRTIFGEKSDFLCPWCIRTIQDARADLVSCPHCQTTVPEAYQGCLKGAPGLFVPIIGWTSTGKTEVLNTIPSYLTAMNQALDRLTIRYVTPVAFEIADKVPKTTIEGSVRVGTEKLEPPRAYCVRNLGPWGHRTFVFRDCKGEFFHHWAVGGDDGDKALMGDILRRSPVTILTLSLDDIRRALSSQTTDGLAGSAQVGGQADPFLLLNTYLTTVNAHAGKKTRSERRSLIVMLTKADLLREIAPPSVQNYLQVDPFTQHCQPPELGSATLEGGASGGEYPHPADDISVPWPDDYRCRLYLERMEAVSDTIKQWFRRIHPTYKSIITSAEDCDINVRFCMNTAGEMKGSKLYWKPRRTVDPLIWAMELTSGRAPR